MKNLAKPEAFERHRHPPLWMSPLVVYLEWYTGPGAYMLVASLHFYTQFALAWIPTTAPVK